MVLGSLFRTDPPLIAEIIKIPVLLLRVAIHTLESSWKVEKAVEVR